MFRLSGCWKFYIWKSWYWWWHQCCRRERKKAQRNKCSSIVRLKPNILNQMAYHSSLQRHGGSRVLKTTPHPPPLKTDLLNLNGGSCGYYYMDENVMMTNWMSPLSNDKELFHALSVSCRLISSCVPEAFKHVHVFLSGCVHMSISILKITQIHKGHQNFAIKTMYIQYRLIIFVSPCFDQSNI